MAFSLPRLWGVLAALVAVGGLGSCVDDNYDLSDIDTLTRIPVNNLTVPVNVKDFDLDRIIDIGDRDPDAVIRVREVAGKKYYFLSKSGDFKAEPENIDKIYAPKPDFAEETVSHVEMIVPTQGAARREAAAYADFRIKAESTPFEYHVGRDGNPRVDDAIESVAAVTFDADGLLNINMKFTSQEVAALASKIEIYNLDIKVPTSFTARCGDIKAEGGHIVIPYLATTDGEVSVDVKVSHVDFTTTESPEGMAVSDGCFDFRETIGFNSGVLRIYPKAGLQLSAIPRVVDFTARYDLSPFTVSLISGKFDIDIDIDDVDALRLTDIPAFFADKQTNISLVNPALSLELNNPVAQYGLECVAGLTLSANRPGGSTPQTLQRLTIPSTAGRQYHIIAPDPAAVDYLSAPAGETVFRTSFPGLGNLLAGDGLPQSIGLDFSSAGQPRPVVRGRAVNYPLGVDLPQVNGRYRFETPLALADDSRIIYSKTIDGWNDDELDNVEISALTVRADITTDIPAGAVLRVWPVDADGRRIPLTNEATAYATLQPRAIDEPLAITLEGDIRHLDGIYVEAVVDGFDGTPLSPVQTIKISNLRATVTGSYTKEL